MIGFQRRPPRWLSLSAGLALVLVGTFSMVNSAQADDDDTSWYVPGHVYDEWSEWVTNDDAGQYVECDSPATFESHGADPALVSVSENIIDANITSGLISIGPDMAALNAVGYGFIPGDCLAFSPLVLTNDTDMPVEVSFAGFGESGTGASYFFEWMGDQGGKNVWQGTTVLQPGESTKPFAVTFGFPKDVPNASKGTGANWWATFNVVAPAVLGTVWNDVNDDGVLGSDEPLLKGFDVAGYNSNSVVVASGTTDNNGAYSFFYEGGIATVTITIADPTKWQPKWLIVNGETIKDASFSVSEDGTEYSYALPALEPGTTTTFDVGLIDLKPETKQSPSNNSAANSATTNTSNPVNPTENAPSIDAGTGGQVVNSSDWAGCAALAVGLAAGCVILATRRKALN